MHDNYWNQKLSETQKGSSKKGLDIVSKTFSAGIERTFDYRNSDVKNVPSNWIIPKESTKTSKLTSKWLKLPITILNFKNVSKTTKIFQNSTKPITVGLAVLSNFIFNMKTFKNQQNQKKTVSFFESL